MIKRFFLLMVILLSNIYCEKKNKNQLEKTVKSDLGQIPNHKNQPMYGLQVDKSGCRVSLWVNDWNVSDYWENGGFTTTETITPYFIKSGKQTIQVKIYPELGSKYINDKTYISLELFYAKQKEDPMDKYILLKTFKLPEEIKNNKLPYFEMTIPFDADIPWDHTAFFDNLQDLRKIPDIENKLLAEYKKCKTMVEKNMKSEYIDYMSKNRHYELETFYANENEVKEYLKSDLEDVSPLKNKEVQILDTNYEIVYELNGKVASIISKTDRDVIIKIYFGDIISDGIHKGKKQNVKGVGPRLILPKGKTTFEVYNN